MTCVENRDVHPPRHLSVRGQAYKRARSEANFGSEAPPFKSPAIRFAPCGLSCPKNKPSTESIRLLGAYTARRERFASDSKDRSCRDI